LFHFGFSFASKIETFVPGKHDYYTIGSSEGLVEKIDGNLKEVVLGLGTNLGDRSANLEAAIAEIGRLGQITARSPIYESEAWGYEDPNSYLNMICMLKTALRPELLHLELIEIEKKLGRAHRRSHSDEPYRARRIDIDILFFGEEEIISEHLHIPHPRLHQRNFVLIPLVDIRPDLIHPVFKLSAAELLAQSPDKSQIHLWTP
jgi:2-amino-4-hydroxy-6-hydroxymethyldihydropteridine diphosphokinase